MFVKVISAVSLIGGFLADLCLRACLLLLTVLTMCPPAEAQTAAHFSGVTTVLNVGNPGGVGLNYPADLALDAAGNLFIADANNSRIVEVSASGSATVLNIAGYTLNQPYGVAVDPSGTLYIADTYNHRVIEVTVGGVASVLNVGTPNGLDFCIPARWPWTA